MVGFRWGWILVVGAATAALGLTKNPMQDGDRLLQEATAAYKLQSFNEAATKAKAAINNGLKGAEADAATRIVGLSQLGLRQDAEGLKTLDDLTKRVPQMRQDAEIAEALAKTGIRIQEPASRMLPRVDRAVSLFAAQGNSAKQASLLFELVDSLRQRWWNLGLDGVADWRLQRVAQQALCLHTYDRILKLGGDADQQVRALSSKASVLRDSGMRQQELPRAQWPVLAGIEYPEGLEMPLELSFKFEREIVSRFPDTLHASAAQFRIGTTYEQYLQQFVDALAAYEKVVKDYPASREAVAAKNQIAGIKAPQIGLYVQGVAKAGERPKFSWNARNVKEVELVAYSVDLFDYIRKVGEFHEVSRYPLANLPKATEWSFSTGDDGKHNFLSSGQAPPPRPIFRGRAPRPPARQGEMVEAPIEDSGAYIVVASGKSPEGATVEVRSVMVVSQLGMLGKTGKAKSLTYVVDSKTGKPVDGTDLLVQRFVRSVKLPLVEVYRNEYSYEESKLPDSGLAEIDPKQGEQNHRQFLVIARHGKDFALLGDIGAWYGWWWYQQQNIRVYCYTERPVYRPEQTVQFRHIVRQYRNGEYHNLPNATVRLLITDPRGSQIYDKPLVTSEFGSVAGNVTLAANAPLGQYRMQMIVDGNSVELGPGAVFRVEEYKKPEFEVQVLADKTNVKVGQKLQVRIHGEFYYGGPVANASVAFTIHRRSTHIHVGFENPYAWFYEGDGEGEGGFGDMEMSGIRGPGLGRRGYFGRPQPRTDLVKQGTLKTDAKGDAVVEIETTAFDQTPKDDLEYVVEAKMTDQSRREIVGSKTIKVTHQAFAVALQPGRHVYQPGDVVRMSVKAADPNGTPVSFKGERRVYLVEKREEFDASGKRIKPETLKEVDRQPIAVGASGEVDFTFTPADAGYYKVVVSAPEPFGGTVEGDAHLWIAKQSGALEHYAYRDLELVVDRDTVSPGENLKLLVASNHPDTYVLLTAEADDVHWSRVVYVKDKTATIDVPVTKAFQPNVTLRAAMFHGTMLYQQEHRIKTPPLDQFLTVTIKASKSEFRPRESAEIEVVATDRNGKPVSAELSIGAADASVYYIQSETRGDIRKYYYGRPRPDFVRTASSYDFQFMSQVTSRTEGAAKTAAANFGGMAGGAPSPLMSADAAAAPGKPAARMAGRNTFLMGEEAGAKESLQKQKKDAGPNLVEAEVRSEFPDTVYWAANVVTDANGRATATIKFPDSLTTWRLITVGATKDTDVGETKLDVQTKKNLIVRMQRPRFAVERDTVVMSAIVNNYLKQAKKVRVSFSSTPEISFKTNEAIDVDVPAGGEKRVDFVATVQRPGKATLLAKALTDEESDAVRQDMPVLEYGAQKLLVENGVLTAKPDTDVTQTVRLTIPKELRPGSQKLAVTVSPTIAGVMLESLPYLIDYPYGCVEQTMSRFLPAVLASHTLKKLGLDIGDLRKMSANDPQLKHRLAQFHSSPVYDREELNKIVAAGVKRLADFQHADGGWGWWKDDSSNPYLTAYVVSGLAVATQSGVALPAGMLDRGVNFLADQVVRAEGLNRYPWQQTENVAVRAYLLYAIGEASPERLRNAAVQKKLAEVFAARSDLSDYSRALLAMALNSAGMREQADIVVANIKDRVQVDKETGSASWGAYQNYYYWYDCGTEATSFSLRALLRLDPNSPLIPQTVNWLLRHRQGTRWFNTKDTAIVCYAMADYLVATRELDPDLTITVDVAGRSSKTFRFTRANLLTGESEAVLLGDALGTGDAPVTVKCQGRGKCYFTAAASFFTKEEKITEAGNELFVSRSYEKLTPRTVEKQRTVYDRVRRKQVVENYNEIVYDRRPLTDGESLKSGDLIDVTLKIAAKNNFEYLLFEDPKPAGCEATELKSGYDWGGGLGGHREMRDQKVAFFVTYLNKGDYQVQYRLRAEIPGTFHALPSHAECMYAPLVRGNGASNVVTVVDQTGG